MYAFCMEVNDFYEHSEERRFFDVTDDELEQAQAYLQRKKGEAIDAQLYELAATYRWEEFRFRHAMGGAGLVALRIDRPA